LETCLLYEELRGIHHSNCLKPSYLNYQVSILYPMFLHAVTRA